MEEPLPIEGAKQVYLRPNRQRANELLFMLKIMLLASLFAIVADGIEYHILQRPDRDIDSINRENYTPDSGDNQKDGQELLPII